MHRLLVDSDQLERNEPEIGAAAARHLRVIRPRDGEEIALFDGAGRERVYRYRAASRALAAAGEMRTRPRPARPIELFAALTKPARWDWTVEKCVELGVARIVPVVAARSVVRIAPGDAGEKLERWRRIAGEAARQSDAFWLPEIAPPASFAGALAMAAGRESYFGALVSPPPPPLAAALAGAVDPSRPIAFWVGPEGDFTPEEKAALAAVAAPVALGSSVLRSETAAVYGIAVIAAAIDAAAYRKENV